MQIYSGEEDKWVSVSEEYKPISIGEIKTCKGPSNVDTREILLHTTQLDLQLNRYGGLYKTAATDTRLQMNKSKLFKIVVEREAISSRQWVISSLTAEAHIAWDSEISTRTLKGMPATYLRACMSDPAYFPKFNKAILELTTSPDAKPHLRLTACQLLHKIIRLYPQQVPAISKNINLASFIHLNIYQQDKANVGTAVDLLQQLCSVADFSKQIHYIILQDIGTIPTFKLSASGKKSL
jgi:hypothetical protein